MMPAWDNAGQATAPRDEVYQMAEIALQVIDQVTTAMDFDRGADHDDVVKRAMGPGEPAQRGQH